MKGFALGSDIRAFPSSKGGNPVQGLQGIGFDAGCFEEGGVEVVVDHGYRANLPCRDFSIWPAYDQGHADSTFVQLTLAPSQRGVGSSVGFPSVVAGEKKDRVFGQAQFRKLAGEQTNSVVYALEHGGQVRVVAWRPMSAGGWVETRILAKIAILPFADPRRVFLKVLGYQIGPAVEDGVRGIVTEVKKEGFVLVAFYEFDRFQIQTVGQVLVFAHPVFGKIEPAYGLRAEGVGPEVRSVAHALDFAPGVPVKSVVSGANFELGVLIFVAGQVPFADHAGGVAVSS